MKYLKISFLLCGCILQMVAKKADNMSAVDTTEPDDAVMAKNLLLRNPFIPFKIEKSLPEDVNVSTDFDFLSYVVYPDHQEFSLKEKTNGKSFWLNSNKENSDENYGLTYWNFYPSDKRLVVQDTFNGNLISLQQKEIKFNSANSSYSSYGGSDWLSLLSDYDDDDDDDEALPKKLTKGRK